MPLPLDAVICATEDQVSTSTGTDVVILGLTNGTYYGLNDVGQCVWDLIKKPTSLRSICNEIVEIYDVEPSRCQSDIVKLIEDLLKHQLARLQDASG